MASSNPGPSPRVPPSIPHDKRLAVEVEDHPLDYGDFEGTIPKGQYGGGTVMVWDRGYWDCEDPERAYRKGKLDFTLEGEKLHGGWILTRMRKREGEKRTNWLLIKHRDEFAREGKKNRILDEDTSVASGRSMDEIAAGKGRGPKPFVTAKKIASARKSRMEIPSRCRARIVGEETVSPGGGPKRSLAKEKGFQKKADSFRSEACRLSSRRNYARRWTGRRPGATGSTRSNLTATAFRCGSRAVRSL